ncbi:MAG: serine hydrolase [Gemmatimonadetes bacterium]|nr:serine hydrolase [Gemmatimonadota bacterium]
MTRVRRTSVAFMALLLVVGLRSAPAQPAPLSGLDAYVEQAMQAWGVPGLAIAVVKNDQMVYARGFGVKELGKPDRVDEHSLFAVGSTSKAFTAAAVGMLVDEGRLGWDDRVVERLPGFQLYDPYVTREMRVRDLLTHRSGLSRGDRLWYGSTYDREEILRRVRYLQPTWGFRTRYGYQNIMFLAAGQMLARIAGMSWDDLVRTRIFEPLGMRRTNTSVLVLKDDPNVAMPHVRAEDGVHPVPYRNIDNIAPAGSINSSVRDMAQWIRLQLGEGSYEGQRLVSPEAIREMHAAQMLQRIDPESEELFPTTHFQAYGLAWSLQDYHGRKLAQHGGGIDGMAARVALMPEEELGVVILSNLGGNGLVGALAYRIFDAYLGVAARDWSGIYLERAGRSRERAEAEARRLADARIRDTRPSLVLERYAGTYVDSLYGPVQVTREGNGLVFNFGLDFAADLEHWHLDAFAMSFRHPVWRESMGKRFVTFVLNPRGEVEELVVPMEVDVPVPVHFRRARKEEGVTATSR